MSTRSKLLVVLLLAGLLLGGQAWQSPFAFADGGSGSGSGSGSGKSGGDGGGGGGGNSGPGGGDDHGGGGDSGDDDTGKGGKGKGRDGDDAGWTGSGAGDVRNAVAKGWAVPLASVLKAVRKKVQGRVLDVDLSQTAAGKWVYRILVLNRDGRYQELTVDARRSEILRMRTR